MSAPRQAMLRADGRRALSRRIALQELMPPEERYRPRSVRDGGVAGTFFFVFGTVFAALYLAAPLWPAFILLGVFLGRSFVTRAAHGAAVQQNQTAVTLLNAGRVKEAADIFDALAHRGRHTAAHPVYVFNRAVCYVLQGRPRRAYSLFNAVERSGVFSSGYASHYLPLLYIELGTCLALLGQLDEARRYCKLAHSAVAPEEHGRVVFLDALLLARSGELDRAENHLRTRWREAESMLRVPTMKALRLVYAYTVERRGQASPADVRAMIQGLAPFDRGEFDWVGSHWPDFLKFLEHHKLR